MIPKELQEAIDKEYPINESSNDLNRIVRQAANIGARLALEYMGDRWVDIKDKLPNDGEWVIGCTNTYTIPVEYKRRKFYRLTDYYMGDPEPIIKWMPLPSPPFKKDI